MTTNLFPVAIALASLTCGAVAQNAAPAPSAPPTMHEVAPGIFEIGRIRLDQKALTVSFPGAVNMSRGLLEYLIVTPQGAKHESLLVSDVPPSEIHLAMLLMGAKGSGEQPGKKTAPPAQIDAEFLRTAPKLNGDSVFITMKWKDGNTEKTGFVEDWLVNERTKKPVEHGPWIYNGSILYEGHFLAQSEGSIGALVTNPVALINNPREGSDDDQVWLVNENAVPAVKTPVEITIRLEKPTVAPSPEKK